MNSPAYKDLIDSYKMAQKNRRISEDRSQEFCKIKRRKLQIPETELMQKQLQSLSQTTEKNPKAPEGKTSKRTAETDSTTE